MGVFRDMHIFMEECFHPQSAEYAILERVRLMKPKITSVSVMQNIARS